MGISWPDFLSLSIQIGHDSRECHKARLHSHESANCHCIVHWFSLLFLRGGINRWRSTWARPQYVRSRLRDVLFFRHGGWTLTVITLALTPGLAGRNCLSLPDHSKPLTGHLGGRSSRTRPLPGQSHTSARFIYHVMLHYEIPGHDRK